MTRYELTYTNMDGRKTTREFNNAEDAINFANNFTFENDKNLKLVKIEETEIKLNK